jgi:predicted DNA-binding transcriptional regulator AlpA
MSSSTTKPSGKARDDGKADPLKELLDEFVRRLEERLRADRFLRQREVLPLSGFGSLSTLKAKVRVGEFPQPITISEGRVAWSEREIIDWQHSKIAERDARLKARVDTAICPMPAPAKTE